MHKRRPSTPRVAPIEKVAVRAREAMANGPANAVNVVATLATSRDFNKAFGGFAQTLLFRGSVDARLREIVILRMGWNCQAVYEFGQHTLFGRDAGLTDAEIYAVTRPLNQHPWTDEERAVLQLVDDLYADDCVSDATWAEASRHFDDAAMVHLLMAAGCYRVVSGFLNSCGVQLDDGVPGWPTAPTVTGTEG